MSQRESQGADGTPGGAGGASGASEQERKLKQYLEDERIALFLQNEEFMRELQRNREFLVALERGMCTVRCSETHSLHGQRNGTGRKYLSLSHEAALQTTIMSMLY